MVIKGQHIKVIVDHSNNVHAGTVREILHHIRHEKVFALYTDDEKMHIVFYPWIFSASYSTGEFATYLNLDTFLDIIKLALYEYRNFISIQGKKIPKPNAQIRG